MFCVFENKDVHAIDYATGDIVHEFIFKDESIPTEQELDQASNKLKTNKNNKGFLGNSASGASLGKNASQVSLS